RARALEAQAESVLAQELIHLLPQIAREYAQAIGAIDNMTVVSTDGTSKVAGEAMGNLKGLLDMARDTVGIDLAGMLNGAVAGGAAGAAAGRASSDAKHEQSANSNQGSIADRVNERVSAARTAIEDPQSSQSANSGATAA